MIGTSRSCLRRLTAALILCLLAQASSFVKPAQAVDETSGAAALAQVGFSGAQIAELETGLLSLGLDPGQTAACILATGSYIALVAEGATGADGDKVLLTSAALAGALAKCLDPDFPDQIIQCLAPLVAINALILAALNHDPITMIAIIIGGVAAALKCYESLTKVPTIDPPVQTRQKGEEARWKVDIMKDLVPRTMSFDYGDGTPPTTVSVPAGSDVSTFYFSHTFAGGIASSSSSEASESTSVPDTGTGTYVQTAKIVETGVESLPTVTHVVTDPSGISGKWMIGDMQVRSTRLNSNSDWVTGRGAPYEDYCTYGFGESTTAAKATAGTHTITVEVAPASGCNDSGSNKFPATATSAGSYGVFVLQGPVFTGTDGPSWRFSGSGCWDDLAPRGRQIGSLEVDESGRGTATGLSLSGLPSNATGEASALCVGSVVNGVGIYNIIPLQLL